MGGRALDEQAAQAAGVPLVAYRNPELAAVAHVSDYIKFSDYLCSFWA